MKLLEINSVPYGSTATIALSIAKQANKDGIEALVAFGYSYHPIKTDYVKIGGYYNKALHLVFSRITGLHGVFSYLATIKFIKIVAGYNPDIIHIHNLHGWYINIPLLLRYINKNNKKVVLTMHDCWVLTGHCPHFDMIGCEKWKTECHNCPEHNSYPKTYIDSSKLMHRLKKKWFGSIKDLTIVTPSKWLQKQVTQSYLSGKRCVVINNGINLEVFNSVNSDFRVKFGVEDKFIILGVSFGWDNKKGLDVFIKLANDLPANFKVILVGTDENVEKLIPKTVLSIRKTQNPKELAEIYSSANVFANFTREDTFPTVNIEALACGLPVITFNTGGSPEIIDETCGIVINKDDYEAAKNAIIDLSSSNAISSKMCRDRALLYNKEDRFSDYVKLFKEI